VNSTANTSTGNYTIILSVPADGVYSINATSYDLLGYASSSVKTNIAVDSTAPTLVALTLSDPTPTKAGSVNFTLDFSEAMNTSVIPILQIINSSTYNITSIGWSNSSRWSGYYTFTTSTGDGNYSANITAAKDLAGNTIAADTSNTFLLDTTAPQVNLTLNATLVYVNESINVTCTATDNLDSSPIVSNNNATTSTAGVGRINCTATDHAGNTNTTSATYIVNGSSVIILEENVSVNENQTQIIVPENNTNSNITVPSNVTNSTLDLSAITNISDNSTSATLNGSINVSSNTSEGVVDITIPSNVTINATINWTGVINLPKIADDSSVIVTADSGKTATVSVVVEVGAGNVTLNFSRAVRILLPNQAGKYAGYYRNGAFTKITITCTNDSQEVGDNLSAGGDCKIDSSPDLVIWTKHFTSFVTYTQENAPTGSREMRGGSSSILGSTSFWVSTKAVNDTEFGSGYTTALKQGYRLRFSVGGIDHYAGIVELTNTTAKINVSSDPQQVSLLVGQDAKLDINADSYYDVYLKLNSIASGWANVTIKGISEKIPSPTSSQQPTDPGHETTNPPTESPEQPPAKCTEDDKRCLEGDLQLCVSGQWILQEICLNGCDAVRVECIKIEAPETPDDLYWKVEVLLILILLAVIALVISKRQKRKDLRLPLKEAPTPEAHTESKVKELEKKISRMEMSGRNVFSMKAALDEIKADISSGFRNLAEGRIEALRREIELAEGTRTF